MSALWESDEDGFYFDGNIKDGGIGYNFKNKKQWCRPLLGNELQLNLVAASQCSHNESMRHRTLWLAMCYKMLHLLYWDPFLVPLFSSQLLVFN